MNQKFEDKRTIRHLKEHYIQNRVCEDEEHFRDFKNILLSFYEKYYEYLNLTHIKKDIPKLIKNYTFVEYCDLLIDNL